MYNDASIDCQSTILHTFLKKITEMFCQFAENAYFCTLISDSSVFA